MSTIRRLKFQLAFSPMVSNGADERQENKVSKLFETQSKIKTIISNLDNISSSNQTEETHENNNTDKLELECQKDTLFQSLF